MITFAGGLLLAIALHLTVAGTLPFTVRELAAELIHGPSGDSLGNTVLWNIRIPRAGACLFGGMILGLVGAVFQTLFRNPLVEPYVIGVSSGAALGGTLAVLAGISGGLGATGTLLGALVGGLAALGLVLLIGRGVAGAPQTPTVLVAGVVIGTLLASAMSVSLLLAGQDTNRILRWLLGSATPMQMPSVFILAGSLIVGGLFFARWARSLNAFASGEFMAARLGVAASKLFWLALGLGSVMVSLVVGTLGIVGFLGLIAPHLARAAIGPDLRRLLPAAALLGGILLLLADLAAQRVRPGMELPLSAMTAILAAPVLLVVLRRTRWVLN